MRAGPSAWGSLKNMLGSLPESGKLLWPSGQAVPCSLLELFNNQCQNLPGGPLVENPSSNAGNVGLIPGQGTKIPLSEGELRPPATTRKIRSCNKDPTSRNQDTRQTNKY